MRRSLRVRLLAIVLIGILLLTFVGVSLSIWQLFRVRDSAIADSSQALQQQAEGYLQNLAQVRADSTGQTLDEVREITDVLRDYLIQTPDVGGPVVLPDLQTAPNGWRYAHDSTTILLPPVGSLPPLLEQLGASQSLNLLLPGQVRRVPEIVRISYLSALGAVRTYPQLEPDQLPSAWSVQSDQTFQLSQPHRNLLRTTTWSPVHLALDGTEQVLSSVAPVYKNEQFIGAIVVDVSLRKLTSYLEKFQIEQSGFALVLDHEGHMIAAPELGQQLLLGRVMAPSEQGAILLDATSPGLEAALLDMRRSRNGSTTVVLAGRNYLLSYAPIPTISWNQALLVPLDEITAATARTIERIAAIARETQVLGMLVTLCMLVLISLVMSTVLRRNFVQPLDHLMKVTNEVAAGNLQPIVVSGKDEIGQLAAAFNTMTRSLQASRDQLLAANQQLEQTVQERTHELRKALEAAEDANRLKTQFLANMSHELRTPLNAIINFSDMIGLPRFGTLTERQQDLQQRILSNAEHLLGLINDILDLSKIESGHMELFRERVDLQPILKGVLSTGIGLTKDKGLSLDLEADDVLPPVWIDKIRIRQVLLNLLSNAAKFTKQGGIVLRVTPYSEHFICIAVQDTGIGIAPEHQKLVFEEFRQVQGDMTREYQGTGLGLPISKRLVEMHGGRMWLESTPELGSTFFFTLPVVEQLPDGISVSTTLPEQVFSAANQAADEPTPLVTIIDDDPNAHEVLRYYLEDAGYAVHSVLDSRMALTALLDRRPRLIILDVNMPHVSGWDILAQLKTLPLTAQIPVLLCTVIDKDHLGGLYGANGYIAKPVQQVTLLDIVRLWVGIPARVLVVDDDADARLAMRVILEEAGCTVCEATNGEEGLQSIVQHVPSLVILDLMMPKMDGFEVLRQLREEPQHSNLPVIVVTARDLEASERQWLLDRTQHFVQKSQFSRDTFIAHIRALLSA